MALGNIGYLMSASSSSARLYTVGCTTGEEIKEYYSSSTSNDEDNLDTANDSFIRNKTKELRQAITRSWEGMSEEEDSSEDDNTTSTPNFFMELLNEC